MIMEVMETVLAMEWDMGDMEECMEDMECMEVACMAVLL